METEHFLKLRKSTEIRFPWVVGPFIIKNKASLPMIERLLREMGFPNEAAINYDPRHIISIRTQVNKNKPFKHFEVAGLPESANWLDYPHETQGDVDMQEDSASSTRKVSSLQLSTSSLILAAKKITLIASWSDRTNKRDFYDAMDTEEEDTTKTSKKQKVEET